MKNSYRLQYLIRKQIDLELELIERKDRLADLAREVEPEAYTPGGPSVTDIEFASATLQVEQAKIGRTQHKLDWIAKAIQDSEVLVIQELTTYSSAVGRATLDSLEADRDE